MADTVSTPRSKSVIDIHGQRFGKLTVTGIAAREPGTKLALWHCRCDCGNEITRDGHVLRRGHTKSCGCLKIETAVARLTTHGLADRCPEYSAWLNMRQRCYNQRDKSYKDYGGRGITVCAEWRDSFAAFYADVGPRPSPEHSIDRVDNDRGYEQGNVRWSLRPEQNLNTRRARKVLFNGELMSLAEAAQRLGITNSQAISRWKTATLERLAANQGVTLTAARSPPNRR